MDKRAPWFKLVLLGEVDVGKTSLFHRVKDKVFRSPQNPTVCIDSCMRTVHVKGQVVKLTLWDTAGVEKFRTLTRNYYRNAHGAILVYDVTEPASLYHLSKWSQDARSFCPSALPFLVGNKTDLDLAVSKDTAKQFAEINGCECLFLCSAKSGSGIESALKTMTEKLLEHYERCAKQESMNIFEDSSIDINKNRKSGTFSTCPC